MKIQSEWSKQSAKSHYRTIRDEALDDLSDQVDDHTIRSTVLLECYRRHPVITFEDVLELNVVVPDSFQIESEDLTDRIETVLDCVLVHLTLWTQLGAGERS